MAKFVELRLDKRVQEALAAFQIWSFCCFKSHLKGNRQPLFYFLESALSTALVWYAGSGELFLCFSSRRPASAAVRAGHWKIGTSSHEQLGSSSAPGWRPTCRMTLPEVAARSRQGRLCIVSHDACAEGRAQRRPCRSRGGAESSVPCQSARSESIRPMPDAARGPCSPGPELCGFPTTGEAREDFDQCSTHSYFLYGMTLLTPVYLRWPGLRLSACPWALTLFLCAVPVI